MSKRLIGAALSVFLLAGVCKAQSTNGLQLHGSGVRLSITVTNSSYAVGSDMTVFAVVQNKSTNDMRLESFIVLLTGENGRTYPLTQPVLGDSRNLGGDISMLVRPGQVHKWQVRVELNHYFGAFGIERVDKNIEPGVYTLKAIQYYNADTLHVQSNVLKVRIKE
jgi:hypothetical protein